MKPVKPITKFIVFLFFLAAFMFFVGWYINEMYPYLTKYITMFRVFGVLIILIALVIIFFTKIRRKCKCGSICYNPFIKECPECGRLFR